MKKGLKVFILFFTGLFIFAASTSQAQVVVVVPTYPIMIAQNITGFGNVLIWNDETHLHVKYIAIGPNGFHEISLQVACSYADIPQTGSGNPKIGHFDYKYKFPFTENPDGSWSLPHEWQIDIPLSEISCSGPLYIAAHSVFCCLTGKYCDTAWGMQDPYYQTFTGRRWGYYIIYELQ